MQHVFSVSTQLIIGGILIVLPFVRTFRGASLWRTVFMVWLFAFAFSFVLTSTPILLDRMFGIPYSEMAEWFPDGSFALDTLVLGWIYAFEFGGAGMIARRRSYQGSRANRDQHGPMIEVSDNYNASGTGDVPPTGPGGSLRR